MNKMSNESPIFIVGASRSGTALMRSILNNDPDIWISQETHYFDDLRGKLGGRAQKPLSEANERRCQDYFLSLATRPYGHGGSPESSNLDRAELKRAADAIGRDADAYFEAFCKLRSHSHNRTHWGE